MPSPAFIVDGFMEVEILARICRGVPARRLNLNGKDAAIENMAKRAASIIKIMSNKYYPVYLLVDREGRAESCAELETALHDGIITQGIGSDQVRVVFIDRMIENWILADKDYIAEKFGHTEPYESEGCHGKSTLKAIVNKTNRYDETSLGVDLLCGANPENIAKNSPSFQNFLHKWSGNCYWLKIFS